MSKPLKIGVVGIGRMGSLHAKLCGGVDSVELVAVCDVDEARGMAAADKYGCTLVHDVAAMADAVDAVIVAVPTGLHKEVGGFFLEKGIPTLVEKPLASTVKDADALLEAAEKGGAILHVGHVERFNPAVAAVGKLVTEPRFIDCRRISPFPFRSADVGVVLDVMIHDIDIVLYLCRSEVKSIDAVGVKVLSSSEDIANARITFESGCVADVTASRVSLKKERQIRIFQLDSYVSLDYEEKKIRRYTKKPGADEIDVASLDPSVVGDPAAFVLEKLISVDEIEVEDYNPLEREIAAFAACVAGNETPAVTGAHGRQAVAVAQRIREEMERVNVR